MPDPVYSVQIVAKKACGCEASIEFELEDEPTQYDVAAVLAMSLDPDQTNLFEFLSDADRCVPHGPEKLTLTAQLKVR